MIASHGQQGIKARGRYVSRNNSFYNGAAVRYRTGGGMLYGSESWTSLGDTGEENMFLEATLYTGAVQLFDIGRRRDTVRPRVMVKARGRCFNKTNL